MPDDKAPPVEPTLLVFKPPPFNSALFALFRRRRAFAARRRVAALPISAVETFPPLLLQTVIVPGELKEEGRLIQAVALPWFDIISLLEKDPNLAYQISPRKWEEIIAGAYKTAGFDEVILTPHSRDRGRDVIATIKGIGSIRVIDSVKAYKPPQLVKYDDVRALIGVLEGDGASKGFLTTTSEFPPNMMTDRLITRWIPAQLQLINREMLLTRLKELAQRRTI